MKNVMNRKQLLEMSAQQIADIITLETSKLQYQSTDAASVKNAMFNEHIKNMFEKDVKVILTKYDGTEMNIHLGPVNVYFKLSATNTKEIVQLTKLKSTYRKRVGKVKASRCTVPVKYFSFEIENESELKVARGSNYLGSNLSSINLDLSVPIMGQLSKENLIELFQKDSSDVWKDIRKGIGLDMIQPFIKPLFMRTDYDNLFLPRTYQKKMPKTYWPFLELISKEKDNVMDVLSDIFCRANSDLVEETIDLMLPKLLLDEAD